MATDLHQGLVKFLSQAIALCSASGPPSQASVTSTVSGSTPRAWLPPRGEPHNAEMTSELGRSRDGGKLQAQGLINASPQASKSRMFHVARVIARERAIAAI